MISNKVLGMLGISAKAGKIVSGADACIESLEKKQIFLLVISKEASDKTKKNFKYYANKYNVPIIIYGSIEDLSKCIGKKNRAIIGVKDRNLASAIEKQIINGGDIIG